MIWMIITDSTWHTNSIPCKISRSSLLTTYITNFQWSLKIKWWDSLSILAWPFQKQLYYMDKIVHGKNLNFVRRWLFFIHDCVQRCNGVLRENEWEFTADCRSPLFVLHFVPVAKYWFHSQTTVLTRYGTNWMTDLCALYILPTTLHVFT